MKFLDVMRPVVIVLQHIWEDWLAHVAASINSRACESTGQSPHYIIFGDEKRLPYDLLSSSHSRVYNANDYVKSQLKVFSQKGHRKSLRLCACNNTSVPPWFL